MLRNMDIAIGARPYTYWWGKRFTNRKHRTIEIIVPIEADGNFNLATVLNVTDEAIRFSLTVRDPEGRPISTKPIPWQALPRTYIGRTIVPEIPYPAGSHVKLTAQLDPDINVGRKRPRCSLALMGYKETFV
jgi:hypothetical protein